MASKNVNVYEKVFVFIIVGFNYWRFTKVATAKNANFNYIIFLKKDHMKEHAALWRTVHAFFFH